MALLLNVLLIIVFATFQLTLGRWFPGATPELIMATILALSFTSATLPTLWWVVIGGIIIDLFPGSIAGFHLLTFSIVAIVVITLTRTVFRRPSYGIVFVISFVLAGCSEFVQSLIYGTMTIQILVPAAITAVIAVVVAIMLRRMGNDRQELPSEF